MKSFLVIILPLLVCAVHSLPSHSLMVELPTSAGENDLFSPALFGVQYAESVSITQAHYMGENNIAENTTNESKRLLRSAARDTMHVQPSALSAVSKRCGSDAPLKTSLKTLLCSSALPPPKIIHLQSRIGSVSGIAVDSSGNVIIADAGRNCLMKLAPSGAITLLAGGKHFGFSDGIGAEAEFTALSSIAIDSEGNILVIDGQRIRKITPHGVVSTLAGSPMRGNKDGVGVQAQFNMPSALVAARNGAVYVADAGNGTVRRVSPRGEVSTLRSRFHAPSRLMLGCNHHLYVFDRAQACIIAVPLSEYDQTPPQTTIIPHSGISPNETQSHVILRLEDFSLHNANITDVSSDEDGNIILAEEGTTVRVHLYRPGGGGITVVTTFSREQCSLAGMLLAHVSQLSPIKALYLANTRKNCLHIIPLAQLVNNAHDSMSHSMEKAVK